MTQIHNCERTHKKKHKKIEIKLKLFFFSLTAFCYA